MIIKNGLVFGEYGTFMNRDLVVDSNHKIASTPEAGDNEIIDAEGLYVIPGLVDIHIHGAVGSDFCDGDAEGLKKISAYLKSQGITSFCPTSMTLPTSELKQIFHSILEVPADSEHARIVGIHMEGPYISPAKKGAQKEEYIVSPDIDTFRGLNEASGNQIKLITIAPELPGSMEFIKEMHDTVSISLGHSEAGYEIADAAYKAGANHATHLFNAMPPLHHRDPGIIGAAADNPDVMVEVICDGIHINPAVIRIIFKIFGDNRVILISDAMRAMGMEDGTYELGGQDVFKHGHRATLADGTLAGSATHLFDCVRNAVSFGIPLESAIKAATRNPAKSIGADHIGGFSVGKEADILLVDKDLNLIRVL